MSKMVIIAMIMSIPPWAVILEFEVGMLIQLIGILILTGVLLWQT